MSSNVKTKTIQLTAAHGRTVKFTVPADTFIDASILKKCLIQEQTNGEWQFQRAGFPRGVQLATGRSLRAAILGPKYFGTHRISGSPEEILPRNFRA